MSNKTINQALTDLYLGLGGDSKELEDNTKVSDYIEDLEGAIKGASSSLIDDSEASEDTTYSSSKIEAILPDGLPEVTSSDNGKFLGVVKDGSTYKWDKVDKPIPDTRSIVGVPGGPFMNFPTGLNRWDLKNLKPSDNVVFRYGSSGGSIHVFSGLFTKDIMNQYAVFIGYDQHQNDEVPYLYIVLILAESGGAPADDKIFRISIDT